MSMTNSVKPLELENILDPRLESMKPSQDKLKWGIFKGCENQNFVQQQANSYSTSGVNWNFNTQSETVLIDRRMYAQVQFEVSLTGTAPLGLPLLNDETDAPRAFPLASVTNSLRVTINGGSVQCQYDDALQALLRYNADFNLFDHDLSQTPNFLDNCQEYGDMVGSVRNPLSNYFNDSYKQGRGAFRIDSLVNPQSPDAGITPITAVVKFTVVEPLLISPMLYNAGDLQSGLLGVKNMGVSFNFKAGKLERVWSHANNPGITITNVNVAVGPGSTESPKLLVNYLNPPLIDIGEQPREIVYQYYKNDVYVNDMNTTLAPNASQTFTNNAIQLSTVPKSIYIYACLPDSAKTFETTDSFFRINSLSLQFLNVSGQFSTMSEHDLYNMSVKNGLKMTWNEFHGTTQAYSSGDITGLTGAVLRIDVDDLAIPSNLASGVNVNSQLSYTINLTNVNQTNNKAVQLVTVLVYDGIMTIADGSMITQVGVIDQYDVVKTRENGNWVDYKSAQSLYGGDFFAKLKSLAKSAHSGLRKACKLDKMFSGGANAGGAIVGGSSPKRCPKGSRKACKPKGGELVSAHGGRSLTRAELKEMLD